MITRCTNALNVSNTAVGLLAVVPYIDRKYNRKLSSLYWQSSKLQYRLLIDLQWYCRKMIACEFRIYFVHFSTSTNEKILTTLTGAVLCYPWWKYTEMHINSVVMRYSLLLTNDRSISRTLVNNYNNCKYLISRGLHIWILIYVAYYTHAHAQYTTQWSTGVPGLYSSALRASTGKSRTRLQLVSCRCGAVYVPGW